jgi:hypothetical protein
LKCACVTVSQGCWKLCRWENSLTISELIGKKLRNLLSHKSTATNFLWRRRAKLKHIHNLFLKQMIQVMIENLL